MNVQDPHGPIKVPANMRNLYLGLYFAGAVLSGAGGNYLFMQNVSPDIIAPDRFTGEQGHALIERVQHVSDVVDFHVNNHPDRENSFDRRIAVLESQFITVIKNQERIIGKLDNL